MTADLRPAAVADVRVVAAIHKRASTGFFMTELGAGFLARYYRLVLEYPDGLLWVAEVEGLPVGFVAGFAHRVGLFWFTRRLAYRLGLVVLRWRIMFYGKACGCDERQLFRAPDPGTAIC